MIDKVAEFFRFEELGADFRTELMAGLTTFMTMAYIIVVNPAILSNQDIGAGMDFGSVMTATCLASAFATLVMALFARYPIALAPGMGMNAFFSFEVVRGFGVPWQTALGMVFIAGAVFLVLSAVRFREMVIDAIPESLKLAAAAGIGLFIAFIGLQHAGLVVKDPATLVRMGDLSSPTALISLTALAAAGLMLVMEVKGAILWAILLAGALGILFGEIKPGEGLAIPALKPFDFRALILLSVVPAVAIPLRLLKIRHALALGIAASLLAGLVLGWIKLGLSGLVSLPPSLKPTAFKLDLVSVFSRWEWIFLMFAFLFFDLFDTVGTLIGVSEQAGFMKEGRLPRAGRALAADAAGTVAGALLGTSTVTSYIESAAGVAAGARTGLASVVTALLFLAALFFSPLVELLSVPMVTAPALIVVGCMMMGSIGKIPWRDYGEALPAFLTMVLMPLTFSISRGLVAGFIAWPLLQAARGRWREVHPFMWALTAVLLTAVVMSYLVL